MNASLLRIWRARQGWLAAASSEGSRAGRFGGSGASYASYRACGIRPRPPKPRGDHLTSFFPTISPGLVTFVQIARLPSEGLAGRKGRRPRLMPIFLAMLRKISLLSSRTGSRGVVRPLPPPSIRTASAGLEPRGVPDGAPAFFFRDRQVSGRTIVENAPLAASRSWWWFCRVFSFLATIL